MLKLIPNDSLGPLELGSLLWNVLNTLRSDQSNRFQNFKLCWDSKNPSTGLILLTIRFPPINLLFDGLTQRLLIIEANRFSGKNSFLDSDSTSDDGNLSNHPNNNSSNTQRFKDLGSWISYQDQTLSQSINSNQSTLNLRVIHRLFGPTYQPTPHVLREEESVVSYPGVAFSFLNDTLNRVILSIQPIGDHHRHDSHQSHHQDHRSDIGPSNLLEAYYRPKLPNYSEIMDGDIRRAQIRLLRSKNNPNRSIQTIVSFEFHSSSPTRPIKDLEVKLGNYTSEDLICDFGAPLRTFWKEDDRMKIHSYLKRSSCRQSGSLEEPNPYFMSYFNLGVDFLIEPISNTVQKVILHSNNPGEVLFSRYSRCQWSIVCIDDQVESDEVSSTQKASVIVERLKRFMNKDSTLIQPEPSPVVKNPTKSKTTGNGSSNNDNVAGKRSKSRLKQDSKVVPKDEGDDQEVLFVRSVEPVMVLDRMADNLDDGLLLIQKPTRLVGFEGIVLEVTEDEDVETIWLF
ncbi:hypothetical protein BY996DRAFT_7066737 [Phakopsora pachyrhizi]|uniref:Uncharacterized protein n=1 Tax=Phakopsora pachyrhizi TaxID=170000 RepID=A0AAV0B5I3_PHAPC|nr:hypothetical protein BY996DRAFT_7066737 [Phakopsora pachyrhizi]CAH7675617.1 hypothetical protein PPACK8108_LOCUS10649 [Phakopsora pachyrhizi]CAH7682220.1 hypothetical protein PPACK8108_LOCUS15010 [Phakopsora pachyrhizi]